jgi:hypothetical protein
MNYTPVLLILPTIPGYKNAFVLEIIISVIFGIFIGIQSAKIKRENEFIVLSLGVLGDSLESIYSIPYFGA